VFERIPKRKRKSEITFSLKTPDSDRAFRRTFGRLQTENYINNETAILAREDEKFTAENKILRKEIKDLRNIIFEEKCKRKREKVLNFYEKDEIKDQILFFNFAKIARARERSAALEKAEFQQKRTAADKRMQQAIAREKKARETIERKARKEIKRIAVREKTVREKIIK
jgi:hypothetical protein